MKVSRNIEVKGQDGKQVVEELGREAVAWVCDLHETDEHARERMSRMRGRTRT